MISKKNVLLAVAIVVSLMMMMFILFGENGLADLNRLKVERDDLLKKNAELIQQNLFLCREIERLKTDPEYVENLARKELGVIRKDEVVIKVKK
ncbi:MAG: septum formation initiator family protein [Desulfobacterales bacterium]|jgi:cell division protein FtsB